MIRKCMDQKAHPNKILLAFKMNYISPSKTSMEINLKFDKEGGNSIDKPNESRSFSIISRYLTHMCADLMCSGGYLMRHILKDLPHSMQIR